MRRPRISHRSFARLAATQTLGTAEVRSRLLALGRMMIDIILLALGVGLFGLMAAYLAGCERV